jgi:parvulin-like peptidyl-prolyl isomerase
MKRYRLVPTLLLVVLMLTANLSFAAGNIVAKIGNMTITKSELETELTSSTVADDTTGLTPLAAKKKVLQFLIERKIMLAEASRLKVEPPKDVLEKMYTQEVEVIGGTEKFQKEMQRRGQTEKQFRQQLLEEYKIQQLLYQNVDLTLKIQPLTMDNLKSYYSLHLNEYRVGDSVRMRHIFFSAPDNMTAEEKAAKYVKAKDALEKIKKGDIFALVAKDYSETRADYGGDVGQPVHMGEMKSFPQIEKIAFSLSSGEHSEIIESSAGYHIIKIENRVYGHQQSLDEVLAKVAEGAQKERAKIIYNDWLAQLKLRYTIEIFEENL